VRVEGVPRGGVPLRDHADDAVRRDWHHRSRLGGRVPRVVEAAGGVQPAGAFGLPGGLGEDAAVERRAVGVEAVPDHRHLRRSDTKVCEP